MPNITILDMALKADVREHILRDPDLTHSPARGKVLQHIESTFNQIIHELHVHPCGNPIIVLKRITAIKPYYDEDDQGRLKWHVQDRQVTYKFPGKNKDETRRFGGRQI